MNYKTILALALLLCTLSNVMGQNQLLLEHKRKPTKKKHLDLDREYIIKTEDTTYLHKQIIAFSDSSLSIPTWTKTDQDTTYSYSYPLSKNKDTTYTQTRPLYRLDTLLIPFTAIQTLKKPWFKNRAWLAPFGLFGVGATMGVLLLPVAAISEGKEGVKNWAVFEALLIGIAAPPIFIGTRKTKYNLRKKWSFKTE